MVKLLFFYASCFILSLTFQTASASQAKIECDEIAQRCVYISKNLGATALISRIREALKPGDILTPEEGYMNAEDLKILSFWFYDEELRQRFERLVVLIDVKEGGGPGSLVQLTTEIYALSEDGLGHINASISQVQSQTNKENNFELFSKGGSLDLSLNLGDRLLGAILGSHKTKTNSSRLTRVVQLIPNRADIGYSRTMKVYISPTLGISKEEQAGLKLSGTVSVNANDSKLTLLKNYHFLYGIHIPGPVVEGKEGNSLDKVNILSVKNPQLYLYNDMATMIVSTQTTQKDEGKQLGLLRFGKDKNKSFSKLMVIIRAKTFTFSEFMEGLKERRQFELYPTFSDEEIQKMPETGEVPLSEVLDSLQTFSRMTNSGDRIVGFSLNKKWASQDIVKKDVRIKIRGGGLKMEKIRSIENLMLSGLRFDSFKMRYMDRSQIKIKVELEVHQPGSKSGKRDRSVKDLYYDPERNTWLAQ